MAKNNGKAISVEESKWLMEGLAGLVELKKRHGVFMRRARSKGSFDLIEGGTGSSERALLEVLSGESMMDKSRRILEGNRKVLDIQPEPMGAFLERELRNPVGVTYLCDLYEELYQLIVEEDDFLKHYLIVSRMLADKEAVFHDLDINLGELASLIDKLDDFLVCLEKDIRVTGTFVRELSRRRGNKVRVRVLDYGEISSVLELAREDEEFGGWGGRGRMVFKKMPILSSREDMERYLKVFWENNRLFKEAGLRLPHQGTVTSVLEDGSIVLYDTQQRLDPDAIGSEVIRNVDGDDCAALFVLVLEEIKKVAMYDRGHLSIDVGIDCQISNWWVEGYDPRQPRIRGDERLWYLDTTTPLFRKNGVEQLDTEVFMKQLPPVIRGLARKLFLQEILDRYYDYRLDVRDLIANVIKEGRPDIVPLLVEEANRFFEEEMADFGYAPLTMDEIKSYYREDRLIWIIVQTGRRIDRFVTEKIKRKPYRMHLPDRIGVLEGLYRKKM